MATNRETYRDAVVTLVNANMVGAVLPLQACYGYQELDAWVDKQSPVMLISSEGTERIKNAAGSGGYLTRYYFSADVFVLYESGGWTAAECEDRLDLVEVEFFELLQANTTSKIKYQYEGRSRAGSAVPGAREYRRERIPFSVTIYKD